jgi:hypothetical protein
LKLQLVPHASDNGSTDYQTPTPQLRSIRCFQTNPTHCHTFRTHPAISTDSLAFHQLTTCPPTNMHLDTLPSPLGRRSPLLKSLDRSLSGLTDIAVEHTLRCHCQTRRSMLPHQARVDASTIDRLLHTDKDIAISLPFQGSVSPTHSQCSHTSRQA